MPIVPELSLAGAAVGDSLKHSLLADSRHAAGRDRPVVTAAEQARGNYSHRGSSHTSEALKPLTRQQYEEVDILRLA